MGTQDFLQGEKIVMGAAHNLSYVYTEKAVSEVSHRQGYKCR